ERIRLSLQILDTASKLLLGTAAIAILAPLGLGGWSALVWVLGALVLFLAQTTFRALVSRSPERHIVWIAPLAVFLDVVALPLSGPRSALARAIRGKGVKVVHDATEEIEYLIEKSSAAGALDEEQRDLLESVIEFSRVRV